VENYTVSTVRVKLGRVFQLAARGKKLFPTAKSPKVRIHPVYLGIDRKEKRQTNSAQRIAARKAGTAWGQKQVLLRERERVQSCLIELHEFLKRFSVICERYNLVAD